MAGYLIVTMHGVSDPEKLLAYRKAAAPIVKQYGGEAVITPKSSQRTMEGEEALGVILYRFPSYDDVVNFYNCPEYRAVKEIRMGAAELQLTIAEGAD